MIFSGEPSIKLKERPFFSIVIPYYNGRKYLNGLLDSIVNQHLPEDIEVIISDDHSTEAYQDIIEQYKDKICIKQVQTPYNFGPGNTREIGTKYCEGKWMTFIDCDDRFYEDVFSLIKEGIEKTEEKYLVVSDFVESDYNDKILRTYNKNMNWNHGKFYNRDNLWIPYDIHFPKNLKTHEDIAISSQIFCALDDLGVEPSYCDVYTYKWMQNGESITRKKYGDQTFLEVFFRDYIDSTAYVYINKFNKGMISAEFAVICLFEVLLNCYFYMQCFMFRHSNCLEEMEYNIKMFVLLFKKTFNLNNKDFVNIANSENGSLYNYMRENAKVSTGNYVESLTFSQWLDYIDKDIYSLPDLSNIFNSQPIENDMEDYEDLGDIEDESVPDISESIKNDTIENLKNFLSSKEDLSDEDKEIIEEIVNGNED